MKYLFALALIHFVQAGLAPAYAQSTWQVKTEQGRDVVIRNVKAGRFEISGGKTETMGTDSRGQSVSRTVGGETKFIEASMTVPYKVGSALGFQLTVPDLPEGDKIVLNVRTIVPRKVPSPEGPVNFVDSTVTYTHADAGKVRNWYWRFASVDDKSWLGTWVRKISQKEKSLAEATFTVVAP
jgi:hypothetical protein